MYVDFYCFFFFNVTATTEIYTYLHTLSQHDALPISGAADEQTAGQRLDDVSSTQIGPSSCRGGDASIRTATDDEVSDRSFNNDGGAVTVRWLSPAILAAL